MIYSQSGLRHRLVRTCALVSCILGVWGSVRADEPPGKDTGPNFVSRMNVVKRQIQKALADMPDTRTDRDSRTLVCKMRALARRIDKRVQAINKASRESIAQPQDALRKGSEQLRDQAASLCNRAWAMRFLPDPKIPGANGVFIAFGQKAITDVRLLPLSNVYGRAPLTELSLSACRGEFEPVSFAVVGSSHISSLELRSSALRSGTNVLPADIADIKIVKCWYQSAGRPLWDVNYTKPKGKVLLPELLLNDDSLIVVDLEQQTNTIRVIDPDTETASRMDITAPNDQFRRVHWSQIKDAPVLRPVDVPAGHCQQFWITVHVPAETIPGTYKGTVTLRADNAPGMKLPLRLVVHPFRLSRPLTKNLIFCSNRMGREYMVESGYIKRPHRPWPADHHWSRFHTRLAVANMRRHGIDGPLFIQSFFVMQGIPGDQNRQELETFAKMMKEEGYPLDRFYYAGNIADTQYPGLNVPYKNSWYRKEKQWYKTTEGPASVLLIEKDFKGIPELGPKATVYLNYAQDIKEALLDLKRRTAAHGFKDFWFEFADELRPNGMAVIYPYLHEYKKAGLKTFAASNPKYFYKNWQRGGDIDGEFLEKTLRAVDGITLSAKLDPRLAALARKGGMEIYSYNNPQAGWETPHTYRRNYGLALWTAGYTGGMNYCYTERYWNDFGWSTRPHCMVYPSADRMIDTLQWEGYRESIDDVRYLSTLLDAIEGARKLPALKPMALDAEQWVKSIDVKDTKGWEGFREGVDDADLDALRRKMVNWIIQLRAA